MKFKQTIFNLWPTKLSVYLNVPFSKKELAKKNKCLWDNEKKSWYKVISLKEVNFEDITGYELLEQFNDLFEFDIKYCEFNMGYYDERNFNIMICRAYNDLQQKWKSGETQKQRAEVEEARNKKMRKKGAEDAKAKPDANLREHKKEQEEVEYVSDSETESEVERRKQEHEKFLKDLMNDKIALHTNFRVSPKPVPKPKPKSKPKPKYDHINFDSDSD